MEKSQRRIPTQWRKSNQGFLVSGKKPEMDSYTVEKSEPRIPTPWRKTNQGFLHSEARPDKDS